MSGNISKFASTAIGHESKKSQIDILREISPIWSAIKGRPSDEQFEWVQGQFDLGLFALEILRDRPEDFELNFHQTQASINPEVTALANNLVTDHLLCSLLIQGWDYHGTPRKEENGLALSLLGARYRGSFGNSGSTGNYFDLMLRTEHGDGIALLAQDIQQSGVTFKNSHFLTMAAVSDNTQDFE